MKSSLPAVISRISTMADGTIRVQLDCQEMAQEQAAELIGMNKAPGWFFFHAKEITQIDTADLPEIHVEKWEKTPSQRLRAVLYRLWEQERTDLAFEVWYRSKMDGIIEHLKQKLD